MNKLFPIVFALLFLSCDEDNIFYFEGCSNSKSDYITYNDIDYYCNDVQILQNIIDANSSLEGEKPLFIGQQEWNDSNRLKTLNLDYNNIDSLPSNIDSLEFLSKLHLSGNNLVHLPDNITNLPLAFLYVDNNQIVSLPESIGNLSNTLYYLYADYNNLTDIPISICNLASLSLTSFTNNDICNYYLPDNNSSSPYSGCYEIDYYHEQDQSNCCEGPEGQPNWTECAE